MSNLIGQTLGRYHILEQLGQGGMATIYKAYDTRLERDVAVKVIRKGAFPAEQLERILKRFEREAKALARLTHPNIVPVIDYGEHEGSPYLVMPYLPGGTLKARLGQPMPWEEALRLLLPVADALAYAHEHNILHRDVKPSNILLTEKGQPMLTDFGIAKILDVEDTQTLTASGVGIGTPEYMSPEQGLGKPVGPPTDVYALGVVLYELVTGRKPYTADTPMAVVVKHLSDPLPRPSQFARDLPEAVEKLLLKALAKQPEDRYQTMGEFAAALENLSKGPMKTRQPTAAKPKPVSAPETMATILQDDSATRLQEATRDELLTRAQSVPETADELTIQLAPGVEMAFVRVPAGPFLMGSPPNEGEKDERPQHEVYLDEFWMGKTPVTNLQYQVFVKATGRKAPRHWKNGNIPAGKENHPVVYVAWQDAQAFCAWLSQISGHPIRLPSEAEWEKAARGTDGRKYPWGNQAPNHQLCNYGKFFSSGTTPVGQYSPHGDSPYGCVDMAGNVWEWVNDWYDSKYYARSPSSNPQGPAGGQSRVLRGGAWYYNGYDLRASVRDWDSPDDFSDDIGFRCARGTSP
jgi:serine/threonine-protein kinase